MEDIFKEVKNRLSIKEVVEHYLSVQLNRANKCCCPFHQDKNASFSIRPSTNTFKCFGCGESGSVIDFVMKYKKVDKIEAIKLLDSDFNLNLEYKETKSKEQSIKSYILTCEKNIHKTDYFIKRGLSSEIIEKHRLGYDEYKNQVIIPYSGKLEYYQARSVVDKKFFKPPTQKAGIEPLYNENILIGISPTEPIFIVESPICAMSIEQYGAYAIATCGGNGINKLSEILKRKKVSTLSFILSFDNDDVGKKFTAEVSEFFKKEKIKFIAYNIAGTEKDPNDLLMKSSEKLVKNIIKAKDEFYKKFTNYGDLKSAKDIMNMQFSPVPWYVDKLFTNGVTLFCGASKSGKSWFVQQLCLAICSEEKFLGQKTEKNACWYMALEDDIELSQSRLARMLQGKMPSDDFSISYEIYPMDKVDKNRPTLMEYIRENIKKNSKIKVVVIDTFQKIRSSSLYGESMFAHDYRDISQIKKVADELKIAIIIIHHTNKMKDKDTNGDPFAKISGTNGLMASADCIFMLDRKRSEEKALLSFIGRKIGDETWEIRQNPINMTWEKVGTLEEETLKRNRQEYENDAFVKTIKSLLERNNGSWTGTCTTFLEECGKYLGYTPNKDISATGKELNALTNKLKINDEIIHLTPDKNGGNNGRLHSFYYINREQEKLQLN